MEVRPGYKQTEVGVIPEDWETDFIENLADIHTGSKNTQDRIEAGRYPFFVRSQIVERINSYSYDGVAVLTAGDGVGTGKVYHYINGKFDVHQRVYRISNFNNRIDGFYFFLFFSNNFYYRIMQMTAKSSVDSVRREMIAKMLVPLPTKAEQQAIAEALSDADALIESLEQLISKKRQIKQGAMQEMLTGKRRLPGFSGEWETRRLGDLGVFYKGQGIRRSDVSDEGVPCIRYGEIYTQYNDFVVEPKSRIPVDIAQSAFLLKTGDILFAGSGETSEEIGKCVAYLGDKTAYAGGDIVILRPDQGIATYLGRLFNHPSIAQEKARLGQGDAVVHISSRYLAQIEVQLPPEDEQLVIATILSDIDAEIEALKRRREKTKQIKQGMMQELLTGRIRLV
jgi:type I restriction enzyme, S subunit